MMMMNFNFVKKDHLLYLQAKILRPTQMAPTVKILDNRRHKNLITGAQMLSVASPLRSNWLGTIIQP